MTDVIPPPRTGEYPLTHLETYPNGRVRRVARLLREYGYFPQDRFTAELIRYYAAYVDGDEGAYDVSRIRIINDPTQQRGRMIDWIRFDDGREPAPWTYAYLVPRKDAAPRVTDPNTRPDMPFLFGVR